MKNNFSKYQGLGNDFIIFDARSNNLDHLFSKIKIILLSTYVIEISASELMGLFLY